MLQHARADVLAQSLDALALLPAWTGAPTLVANAHPAGGRLRHEPGVGVEQGGIRLASCDQPAHQCLSIRRRAAVDEDRPAIRLLKRNRVDVRRVDRVAHGVNEPGVGCKGRAGRCFIGGFQGDSNKPQQAEAQR